MFHRIAIVALGAAAAVSCAHSDQISAADHREMARQNERRADEAEAGGRAQGRNSAERSPVLYQGVVEQPFASMSDPHLMLRREAESARLHAIDHEQAAAALERFEDQACLGVEPAGRLACPLLTPYVSRVVETAHGVQLFFKPGAPGRDINQRIQCHLAFARERGYRDIPSCPLYAPGVRLIAGEGNAWVELWVEGAKSVAELRQRARSEFGASG